MQALDTLKAEATTAISSAEDASALEKLRVEFLGKKGRVTDLLKSLGQLDASERPKAGAEINALKQHLNSLISERKQVLQSAALAEQLANERLDVTLPGRGEQTGSLHPITRTIERMAAFFATLGFDVVEGPEVEDDYHNFEALNVPKHHPARDMQDTFFVNPNTVLRTHTSNVQIHLMENQDPPLRHICCGRVYRNEAVSYKSFCLFNQVEGLVINENSSFAEMKGTLEYFVQEMFGEGTKMRFRPSYFPFTEPSAEVDIWNDKLNQWMEILGCGMVNPNVLANVGYDTEKYQGFAFGMGIERIAMIKYGIKDIRLFYQNDKRFLEQF